MNFRKKVELMREGSRPIGEKSIDYVLYTNADMAQNDPDSPEYVKNRPFYKETGKTITWDGEPTGVSIEIDGRVLHKVSDYIPQTLVDCEVMGTVTQDGDSQEMTYTLTAADVVTLGLMGDKPVLAAAQFMVMVFPYAGTLGSEEDGGSLEVPEAGLYFLRMEQGAYTAVTTKLVCGVYTKKLDPAFLPFHFYESALTDITAIDFSKWKAGEMAFLLGDEIPL